MEKLLHERLREWAECTTPFGNMTRQLNGNFSDGFSKRVLHKLADEIERYYIPRPRFEDGEPVQFGDEFIIDRYMIEPETLKHLGIFSKELLDEWEQYHGVAPVYEMNFNRPNCEDGKIPIIKRTTKVLDADGIEIKVGDTVYSVHGSETGVVVSFKEIRGDIRVDFRNGEKNRLYRLGGEDLTHREPDSLEKLRDDMASDTRVEPRYIDRLTAIMERDA